MAEQHWLERQNALIGEEATAKLALAHVLLFGVGGVGSYACEALARAGIGRLTLVDDDNVSLTNLNRQLIATRSTLGQSKVEVAKMRIHDINPDCQVTPLCVRATEENLPTLLDEIKPDFILDAIDSVKAKVALAVWAKEHGVPLIASMGMGNKLDPTKITLADLSKTEICPLARAVRTRLKKHGILHLPVVFSRELPVKVEPSTPSSISFVPSVAGLMMAGYAVRSLITEGKGTEKIATE